jgi:excisionase family DNA binding protein
MKRVRVFQPVQSAALTVEEAAEYLRVSRTTLFRLFNQKILPRARIGGRTLVRRVDLEALLERASKNTIFD